MEHSIGCMFIGNRDVPRTPKEIQEIIKRLTMSISLTALDPYFVRYENIVETYSVVDGDEATWRERGSPTKEVTGPRQHIIKVDSFEEAQGLWFLCPKCFQTNGGKVSTHLCDVTFEGKNVPDNCGSHGIAGVPTRWGVSGTTFEDLSTTPSILIQGGCNWHGYITNGEVSLI